MTLTLLAFAIAAPVFWTVARIVGALAVMGVLWVVLGVCRVLSSLLGAMLRCLPQTGAAEPR